MAKGSVARPELTSSPSAAPMSSSARAWRVRGGGAGGVRGRVGGDFDQATARAIEQPHLCSHAARALLSAPEPAGGGWASKAAGGRTGRTGGV